jgi:predicted HTH transcriptional regulator
MEYLSLEEIIRKGEGQTLEFKKSLSLQNKGLESLCAMINSDLAQGTVAFGIEPGGTICGIEPGNHDTAQRSVSQTIKNKFEPHPTTCIEAIEFSGKIVFTISAERDRNIPYHEYDGRAWIREGSTNRLLSLSEKEMLVTKRNRDKHQGPWKCDRCGTLVGVLHKFEISSEGMKKTYKCGCGGEFWPAT